MKKKGLIIATIVMVLVLAVSLTTATYAWFSTTASTKVDQVSVKIGALSDVNIGVTSTFGDTSPENYMYDSITVSGATDNTVSYAGGSVSLGTQLSIPEFNLGTAVATSKTLAPSATQEALRAVAATEVNTSAFDPTKLIFAANATSGTGNNEVGSADLSSATIAKANIDYIDLRMGAQIAAGKSASGVYATVTVTTTGVETSLKMNAALYFYVKTNAGVATVDTWGTSTRNTLKSAITGSANGVTYSYDNTSKQATATFKIWIAGAKAYDAEALLSNETISPIEIYGYVWGPDANCVTSSAGCSCTIDMTFDAVTSGVDVSGQTFITIA